MQNGRKNYVKNMSFEKRKKIQKLFKAEETASASMFSDEFLYYIDYMFKKDHASPVHNI
jgi:hypothetical protein